MAAGYLRTEGQDQGHEDSRSMERPRRHKRSAIHYFGSASGRFAGQSIRGKGLHEFLSICAYSDTSSLDQSWLTWEMLIDEKEVILPLDFFQVNFTEDTVKLVTSAVSVLGSSLLFLVG